MGDDDLRGRFRRDFTREPIKSGPSRPIPEVSPPIPAANPEAAPAPTIEMPKFEPSETVAKNKRRTQKKRRSKKKFFVLIFILLILAGGAGGAYKYYYLKPSVPKNIVAQTTIPILYPQKLPNGYSISQQSFNITSGNIITYFAANQTGDRIVFSLQARPANFDYATFYSKGLTDSTIFNTSLGQAAVGTTDGHLLGSLATEQTWIIVSSTSKNIHSSDIRLILENLKEVQNLGH
jgi:hypothetical protein